MAGIDGISRLTRAIRLVSKANLSLYNHCEGIPWINNNRYVRQGFASRSLGGGRGEPGHRPHSRQVTGARCTEVAARQSWAEYTSRPTTDSLIQGWAIAARCWPWVYSLGMVSRYSTVRSGTLTWREWGLWTRPPGAMPCPTIYLLWRWPAYNSHEQALHVAWEHATYSCPTGHRNGANAAPATVNGRTAPLRNIRLPSLDKILGEKKSIY